jgi:molybdopterin/thiamine biosynthesis adenylyltransferase/proteasome lid subunit RPN8/RPN11
MAPYVKELVFQRNGYDYYFKFHIVREYQNRKFDNGVSFSGYGFSIYVIDCPDYDWAVDNYFDFHFYRASPRDVYNKNWTPSICWSSNIVNFEDANAVMYVWAKRFMNIYLGGGNTRFKARPKIPEGSFRLNVNILKSTFEEIKKKIGTFKPETGGLLGSKDGYTIDAFFFDETADTNETTYSPNTSILNDLIEREWDINNINVIGFVHSHPNGNLIPSDADILYANRIMDALSMDVFYLPIIASNYDSEFSINMYVINQKRELILANCKVIKEGELPNKIIIYDEIESKDEFKAIFEGFERQTKEFSKDKNRFARIKHALDLDYLKSATVIGVGCGGARELYIDLARMGVGNFLLLDGDKVETTNLASQNAFEDEVGEYKTKSIVKRIKLINPKVNVKTFEVFLDESLDDDWIYENLIKGHSNIVLAGFTDSFKAQARLNRISQKYKLNYVCSQHHQFGDTSEVLYFYHGISNYCPRCYLNKTRYQAYDDGYENRVTSDGSPIFNTARLNALVEKIIIGLITYKGNQSSKFCSFLNYQPENNLLIVRQANLYHSDSGLDKLFENHGTAIFDDVVWLNHENKSLFPEGIEKCQDCSKEIKDTREIF